MKKLLSLLLLITMALGCVPALAEGAPATIADFADGNGAFFGVETTSGNADACELSVVEYNGGMALRMDAREGALRDAERRGPAGRVILS